MKPFWATRRHSCERLGATGKRLGEAEGCLGVAEGRLGALNAGHMKHCILQIVFKVILNVFGFQKSKKDIGIIEKRCRIPRVSRDYRNFYINFDFDANLSPCYLQNPPS